jgi:hypothetical protein
MNLTKKAKTVSYVAQQFATAASSDTALAIKSVVGLEIGLGLVGKLSIGDNSTLSNLIKAVASEVVLRMTAQVVYSALIQVEDFECGIPRFESVLPFKSGNHFNENALRRDWQQVGGSECCTCV